MHMRMQVLILFAFFFSSAPEPQARLVNVHPFFDL